MVNFSFQISTYSILKTLFSYPYYLGRLPQPVFTIRKQRKDACNKASELIRKIFNGACHTQNVLISI